MTQLEITLKSTRETKKMYFDTVFYLGGTLVGFRSRLIHSKLGITQIDPVDIDKVEIYAEFPSTEKTPSPP